MPPTSLFSVYHNNYSPVWTNVEVTGQQCVGAVSTPQSTLEGALDSVHGTVQVIVLHIKTSERNKTWKRIQQQHVIHVTGATTQDIIPASSSGHHVQDSTIRELSQQSEFALHAQHKKSNLYETHGSALKYLFSYLH